MESFKVYLNVSEVVVGAHRKLSCIQNLRYNVNIKFLTEKVQYVHYIRVEAVD